MGRQSELTELHVMKRTYLREQYACHLRIKPKRLVARGELRAAHRVTEAMTRWLARCARDQAIVTGVAHLTVHEDFLSGQFMIRAWAYAFQDVAPEDVNTLSSVVDGHRQLIEVRYFAPVGSATYWD